MSETQERVVQALRESLKESERLRQQNRQLLAAAREPVAIVGMSCRLPGGVDSPRALWDLLAAGRDAIDGFPADRGWDLQALYDPDPEAGQRGRSYVRMGGFVHDAACFDAGFFRLSPREALVTDPQQRIVLEAAWEAIEAGGLDPLSLRGTRTGVFAGAMYQDYGMGVGLAATPDGQEHHVVAGATGSVISGRVAYALGLEGPAVTIDTACSSSLVALHLACQALRAGECSLALAGGVTVLSTPAVFVEFSRQRALAPDGRCKPFADAADGTSISEGVGLLLLERLSDARRNGHRVLALIRASAINQDGASNGLTAPNGLAQREVIAQALAGANLAPEAIDAVEAHGTGTTLGDPIEAEALLAAYGHKRPAGRPLWLGSVKSNIGHTQATAGVAGVIKMVMSMRAGTLARTLHVDRPSRHVDWERGAVELLCEPRDWPRAEEPRRAAVSSFGISGTNAHVILEEASPAPAPLVAEPAPAAPLRLDVLPWVLSGRGGGLLAQARRLSDFLAEEDGAGEAAVARSLVGRPQLEDRALVVGGDRQELLSGLAALAEERSHPGVVVGAVPVAGAGKVAFVFPGQGSQWQGMAAELMERSDVFAERMRECEAALAPFVDWSLADVFAREAAGSLLERVDVVQPALFAVMVSLAAVWEACGVRPGAVAGHSQGEIAAACVAGCLSLDDAAMVVARRSLALRELAGRGGMVSLAVGLDEAVRLIEPHGMAVSVAAVNGPGAVVVSGEPQALDELLERCAERDVRARRIPVDYAAHSLQVEEIRKVLLDGCEPVRPREGVVPFYSCVTGGVLSGERLDAAYWYRNLRETVQFEQVTGALLQAGARTLVEVSPHPVLTVPMQESAEASSLAATVVGSLRRDEGGPHRLLASLGQAWAGGAAVDWGTVLSGLDAEAVELPTYAFERRRYWLEGVPDTERGVRAAGQAAVDHPLLGAAVNPAPGGGLLLTGRLSLGSHAWLADHAVGGAVLLPGTAFLDLALWAAEAVGGGGVRELTLQAPLVLEQDLAVELQLIVGESQQEGERTIEVYSRPADAGAASDTEETVGGGDERPWRHHASGTIAGGGEDVSPLGEVGGDAGVHPRMQVLAGQWPPPGAQPLDAESLYERLALAGLEYGPAFQALRAAWRLGDDVFVEVEPVEDAQRASTGFCLHPALLDCVLHGVAAARLQGDAGSAPERLSLPFCWSEVRLHGAAGGALRACLSLTSAEAVSIAVAGEDGEPVASVGSLSIRPLPAEQLAQLGAGGRSSLLYVDWVGIVPAPGAGEAHATPAGQARWAALGGGVPAGMDLPPIDEYDDLAALLAHLDGGGEPPAVALAVCRIDAQTGDAGMPEAARAALCQALTLVQEWVADERLRDCRLVMATERAVAMRAGEDVPGLASAAVWGLLRSAQSEHPDRLVVCDLDGQPASWGALAEALAGGEPQLALRDGRAFAPRLVREAPGELLAPPADTEDWRLEVGASGTLDDLRFAPYPQLSEPLLEGQVRIAVRAAGLNFRDVVTALGLVPLRGEWDAIGSEGAGVVVEVGPGVDDLAPGDRVMGILFGGFGPRAIADRRMLARLPQGWSFARGASVPGAFLTAYYALLRLASAQQGERVLVHAAAGGVGMAAVQLARHLGLEVFATASPSKWATLRALGIDEAHVASSRDPDFRERFLEQTAGEGVDVVLNSLARELVDASLQLLPRGGRFVEMGKTDVRDAEDVAARHPGVTYRAFDLLEAGAEGVRDMLAQLLALFETGALAPPPLRAWDLRRAPEAFRHMSQARHVGKIVLTLPAPLAGGEGAALITGGTGELGGLLARHLVREHGIRSLVLVSRRGPQAPGADLLERELAELGARTRIVACDVADRDQIAALLAEVTDEEPLQMVVHAAGLLDDGPLDGLTPERLERVLAPKLDGAWHLHELTADLDLRAFVLFSSAAGTLGAPGQGNYAAANAFLDALAADRRARGLPGVSLAWGWWEQASEMTGHLREVDLRRIKRAGFSSFSAQEGLALLDAALKAPEPACLPLRLDETALRTAAAEGGLPVLLQALVRVPRRMAARRGGSLARRLAGMSSAERERAVLEAVRAEVAAVLGHDSAEAIDPQRAFKELGFDSLLAVELRNRVNRLAGLSLPATLVFDHPNPAALASLLVQELAGSVAPAGVASLGATTAASRRTAVDEPLAIVGMSCRYPGAVDTPQALWRLVAEGVDAIAPFPTDRDWDVEALYDPDAKQPGTTYVREAGFVYDMADFDAGFFGISPREAMTMDPQQRLLLEGAWEALEDAGIDPLSLRGGEGAVFVGSTSLAYGERLPLDQAEEVGFVATGNSASVLSGRVAYALGLEGPAMTIDTACSSSLVALHLASAALRAGECPLALVGGVTVLSAPAPFVEFARQRGLARDGRCKSFAEAADGTNWGEGMGMLVLERLSEAQRHGREILAIVRGSAVNQDGASNGLTAPNGPSQQRVIRRALENAGLRPGEVDAVEAHGTGTTLGDPIEAQALLSTYGAEREPSRPLWLGSIKSNIGHTQAAAGVAGVIKMVMAMRHGTLPRTLHVDEPTSQVDWSAGAVSLLVEERPWERAEAPRRAGVSSFGVSGTNAHVIIEEAPTAPGAGEASDDIPASSADGAVPGAQPSVDGAAPAVWAWPLSAKEPQALRAHAGRLHGFVRSEEGLECPDVASALAARSALEERAVVLGATREEMLAGLASIAEGELAPNVFAGQAPAGSPGGIAFMFAGQGAQRPGMGAELYQAFPRFREALDEVCAELDLHLERPTLAVMFAQADSPQAALLDQTQHTQACLFALEVALWRLLESWGVRPRYLIGHSIGELSAALAAGVFSLPDACKLVAARGRLMGELPGGGAMVAVQASSEEALDALGDMDGRVSLAAVNGAASVVFSGEQEEVVELAGRWREQGRKVSRLRVSHAFHSHRMDAMLAPFAAVAGEISFSAPRVPVVSNLTGEVAAEELCSPDYWVRQVRETVRFADGVRWLADHGVDAFLEIGPSGVLSAMVAETATSGSRAVALLVAERPEAQSLAAAVAELWAGGQPLDWRRVLSAPTHPRVRLPTYPFQRTRYWISRGSASSGAGSGSGESRFPAGSVAGAWRYRVDWKPLSLAAGAPPAGRWLVALPDTMHDTWIDRLVEELGGAGMEPIPLRFAPEQGLDGCPEAVGALSADNPPVGVLSLLALDERRGASHPAVTGGLAATAALLQSLEARQVDAPLWIVTRGAVSVGSAEGPADPLQAQVWGLALAAALEQPGRWGGIVDLPVAEEASGRIASLLFDALTGPSEEDQLALRPAGAFARRVVRAPRSTPGLGEDDPNGEGSENGGPANGSPVHGGWTPPGGTILVTGGTGGLGAHVARWLARSGAQRLLLVSRSGEHAPGAHELAAELTELGSEVTIAACDVADRDRLRELLESAAADGRLGAVVHTAGAAVVGPIGSIDGEQLQDALAAKLQGALNLDALTEDMELGAFVLFSSIAGTLGSGAQGAYAAANAALDALARARRARGRHALSVAWGPWAGEGMAAAGAGEAAEALRRRGVECLAPEHAIEQLEHALLADETSIAVADIRWETYAPVYALARRRPLIEDLAEVRGLSQRPPSAGEEGAQAELRARLRKAAPQERPQVLARLVRGEVARVLGHSSGDSVSLKRPFKDLGFDSLLAVELRNRLAVVTGLELPATLVFDCPTPLAVAERLEQELAPGASELPLLDELARLQRRLAELTEAETQADPPEHSAVRSRLLAMLATLDGGDSSNAASAEAPDLAQRIGTASDEEIFSFIDEQLGASAPAASSTGEHDE